MKFYGKSIPPQGSALITEGTAVWSQPLLLMGLFETPFSGQRCFIRLGKEAWLFHDVVNAWVTADEAGIPEIGLNWSNPEYVLDLLLTCIKDTVLTLPINQKGDTSIEVNLDSTSLDLKGLAKLLPDLAGLAENPRAFGKLLFTADVSTMSLKRLEYDLRIPAKHDSVFWYFQGSVDLSHYGTSQPLQFQRTNLRTGKPEVIPYPKRVAEDLPLHFPSTSKP